MTIVSNLIGARSRQFGQIAKMRQESLGCHDGLCCGLRRCNRIGAREIIRDRLEIIGLGQKTAEVRVRSAII